MKPIFKSNATHLMFLVALLAVILLVMQYLKGDKSIMRSSSIPKFEEQVKVIDNRYYNKIYHFSISVPNTDWEIVCHDRIDSLRKQDTSRPILDNINLMLEMNRRDNSDTMAIIQVGIIDLVEPGTAQSLAKQNLLEIEKSFSPPDTIYVVQDVTLSGSGGLPGAFYVLDFNQELHDPYPRRIAMFVVNNKLAYTIICQVRSEDYAILKSDFEKILQSFRLLKY